MVDIARSRHENLPKRSLAHLCVGETHPVFSIGDTAVYIDRNNIYFSFELWACPKGHDSAWRDDDFLACSRIPSFARRLGPYRKHTKGDDADRFTFLKGGFD